MVAKLDRLFRSLLDFAGLMERARQKGWSLVALDLGVDTSTPTGEMVANVLATFAQFERRLIGQRTRDALAVKREQGVKLRRPREMNHEAIERVNQLRDAGLNVATIARKLNEEGMFDTARWSLAQPRSEARPLMERVRSRKPDGSRRSSG